jgi:hypothetical protein
MRSHCGIRIHCFHSRFSPEFMDNYLWRTCGIKWHRRSFDCQCYSARLRERCSMARGISSSVSSSTLFLPFLPSLLNYLLHCYVLIRLFRTQLLDGGTGVMVHGSKELIHAESAQLVSMQSLLHSNVSLMIKSICLRRHCC